MSYLKYDWFICHSHASVTNISLLQTNSWQKTSHQRWRWTKAPSSAIPQPHGQYTIQAEASSFTVICYWGNQTIEFIHSSTSGTSYPIANTCGLTLRIPVTTTNEDRQGFFFAMAYSLCHGGMFSVVEHDLLSHRQYIHFECGYNFQFPC